MKSIFYTQKQVWWLIGFSMLISGGILTLPQIITGFILNNDFSGIWIIWSALIGQAFGFVFFGHLWFKLPVKTENEFLLFRFSGKGAKILHAFRSIYVGGIIAPLGLAMSFMAFSRIVSELYAISFNQGILIVLAIVLISTFFNSLKQRLRLDFIYFIIFIISFGILFYYLISEIGSISSIHESIQAGQFNFRLFPEKGSIAFNAFLVFVFLQWWSTGIIDMPDINGQKLMSAKNMNTISQSLILPKLFMAIFMILILTIPFYILQINPLHVDYASGELAFVSIFKYAIPKQLYFIVVLFFFLPFLSAVNNTQNWSAALLVQNFYKYYIEKQASDKKLYRLGMLTMIFIVFMAAIFAVFNDSILDIFKYILAISAGVGPVFILRWYWHRINAWTQLSAMVLSLIYPNIYEILYHNNEAFHNGILTLMNAWNLDYHPLKIILLSVSVIGSWLIVTFLTKQTDEKTITQFVDAVKPGGFWPRKSCGNLFFKKRLFIALMLTAGGFLFYFTFWQFVKGNYGLTLLLLVIYLLINYLGYVLLKKLNSRYMNNRE